VFAFFFGDRRLNPYYRVLMSIRKFGHTDISYAPHLKLDFSMFGDDSRSIKKCGSIVGGMSKAIRTAAAEIFLFLAVLLCWELR